MFSAHVLRRRFSLCNSVPYSRIVRSAARHGHHHLTIQRFHIRKPFFSKSRLVGTITLALALYGLARYLGVQVEVQVVGEDGEKAARHGGPTAKANEALPAGKEAGGDNDQDGDGVENALLFIPTGFSRPVPRTFYKGSDPEWQEFNRIATDKPRAEKIRGELVSLIRSTVASIPQWEAKIGKVDTEKGKVWVEITFPDSPPLEFERPGIALTEELEWVKATRPVEAAHHHRLRRLFAPTDVAKALYQDAKRRTSQSWQDLKAYVGREPKAATTSVPLMLPPIGANPLPSSSPSAPSASATPNSTATPPANDTQQATASPSPAPVHGPTNTLGFILPDPKKLTMDLARFRVDVRKTAKQVPTGAPRGSFVVMGMIEVYGSRARVTLNTTAVYDPKQGKYIGMTIGVFNFVEHRQTPKGGP